MYVLITKQLVKLVQLYPTNKPQKINHKINTTVVKMLLTVNKMCILSHHKEYIIERNEENMKL